MTVRHLLGGATLAAAATLLAASSASAQYTFTTTVPSVGPIFTPGSTNLTATATSNNSPVTLGNVALTPFFNYNQIAAANTSFTNATQTLTVTAFKAGVGAATSSQSTTITATGTTSSTGSGAVTLTSFSFAPLTQFVFTFTDGSTLTLGGFGASNATGVAGVGGSSDGIFGYTVATETVPNVAPEPGSFALAGTGILSMMGMVGIRRRRTA